MLIMFKYFNNYSGWVLALVNVMLFWGISNVFIAYSTQVLDVNKIIFVLSTYASCSFMLLIYTKDIYLSKYEIRKLDSWIYSFVMLLNFFVTVNLFSLTTATEASLIQRFSLVVSVFFSWFILLKKPNGLNILLSLSIFVSICYLIKDLNIENKDYIYILMVLSGFLQSVRIFSVESFKYDKKDVGIKYKLAKFAYTMSVITLGLFILAISFAYLSNDSQIISNLITINDIFSFNSIICGFIMGLFIYIPLRLLEFLSVSKISTENYLIVTSLSFISTLFWEYCLSKIIGLSVSEISNLDISVGLIITVSSCLIFINKKMVARRYNQEAKNYLTKTINSNDIEESYDIILSSVEHYDSDIDKVSNSLGVPVKVIKFILEDSNKQFAFKEETLKQVARNYRKNVASADTLTGLLNRTGFMTALKAASFESDSLSLFFIDLNKFKPVNDTYGHEAGDYVLQVIADRLRSLFPHKSLITRLGGDEYCILLLDMEKQEAESHIDFLSKELEKEISYEDNLISVSGSIGLANYPEDTNNAEELISLADKQMYIKKEGR